MVKETLIDNGVEYKPAKMEDIQKAYMKPFEEERKRQNMLLLAYTILVLCVFTFLVILFIFASQ